MNITVSTVQASALQEKEQHKTRSRFMGIISLLKLDDVTSRNFLHVITSSHHNLLKIKMSKFMSIDVYLRELFASYRDWRTFIFYLGTYVLEVNDLEALRVISGWSLVALGYVLKNQLELNYFNMTEEQNLQVYDVIHKIIYYTSGQHGTQLCRWFLGIFGDEFFGRIIGFINLQATLNIPFVMTYFKAIAISLEHNLIVITNDKLDAEFGGKISVDPEIALKRFLDDNMMYILPRLICSRDVGKLITPLVEELISVSNLSKEDFLVKNFPFILDYHLRVVRDDHLFNISVSLISNNRPKFFYKRCGILMIVVPIFNMANNPSQSIEIIKSMAEVHEENPKEYLKKRILGILYQIPQSVISDKYFVNRKTEIAASLNYFFNDFDINLLNTFAAKIFQMLWSMNSEEESFSNCWLTLFKKLDASTLVKQGYKILFYISQLDSFEQVLPSFLQSLQKTSSPVAGVEQLSAVSKYCYDKQVDSSVIKMVTTDVIKSALFESPHLCYDLLTATLKTPNVNWPLQKRLKLFDTFLPLTSHLKGVEELAMLGNYLGQIGAISPALVSNESILPQISASKDPDLTITLILETGEFLNVFVKKLLRWFNDSDSQSLSNMIGFCLHCVCKEYEKLTERLKNTLDFGIRKELALFLNSGYRVKESDEDISAPLITSVNSHNAWITAWYRRLTPFITSKPFCFLHCLSLSYINNYPAIYADFLPYVLLCCLFELKDEEQKKSLIYTEILAVFANLHYRPDVKDSCRFIFAFLSNVDLALVPLCEKRSHKNYDLANKFHKPFVAMKNYILSAAPETGGLPYSAEAAVACSNYYSALYLLELYAAERDKNSGTVIFNHELFSLLQKVFYNLHDADNTQGAYLHIANNSIATTEETLMHFDISGDVTENLSMLSNRRNNWDTMCHYLLKLNQPEVALSYVEHNIGNVNRSELRKSDPQAYSILAACAIELGRWDLIEEADSEVKVQKLANWKPYDTQSNTIGIANLSFEAHLGSILANCRRADFVQAREYFDLAEVCATRSLYKTNSEGGRPYTIGFQYMQQLHTLSDLQMAWPQLVLRTNDQPHVNANVENLMKKWKEHDSYITNTRSDMEPILDARRNILRSLHSPEEEVKSGLTELLVHSCQLARNDNLPDLVLPFLTEALKNGVSNIDIEEQRAFYYAESKDENKRLLAIPIMSNALARFFPKCTEALQVYKERTSVRGQQRRSAPTFTELADEEDCTRFLEAAVEFIEIGRMQRKSCVKEIMKMYDGLEQLRASSERFFYRYANFIDSSFKNHTEQSVRLLIRLATECLKLGHTYVTEMMPRMITVWLDTLPKPVNGSTNYTVPEIQNIDASELILNAFRDIPRHIFYKAFSLFVARLAKFSTNDQRPVYNAMKKIMASLIVEFPHQTILLSISEYRSAAQDNNYRAKAMGDVYKAAIAQDKSVDKVIRAYEFITGYLMQLANDQSTSTQIDMHNYYGEFFRFFDAKCDAGNGPRPSKRSRKVANNPPPSQPIPLPFAYLDQPFKKLPPDVITIANLERFARVMPTLAKPKRLEIRGSDGKICSILCKPDDDLRKDACFMSIAKMMNARLPINKHTRNDGLQIQTFGVIPLEEKGGIIEWVPGLMTIGECLKCGVTDSTKLDTAKQRLNSEPKDNTAKKLKLFKDCCQLYELVMSKWLRQRSTGPASYYQLQRRFTISNALMSAVGFTVGLGDRHTGNVLINQNTAEIMHVDFALLFNAGENLPIPEMVPFRLTRNIIDGFGAMGIEGRFRFTMERSMKFIQSEKGAILIFLKSYLNDPLLKWRAREESGPYEITHKIETIENRLNGYIHSIKYPKTGPFSERELVAKLIETAIDEEVLSKMYIGWSSYV
ncbi:Non-specific serine/threonine protein kinase [Aphelenchoides besseyi]|nr:Non-specific serine/threonine protein kinase [Aphelenchoides besseyi]